MTLLFNTRCVTNGTMSDYVRGAAAIFNLSGRTDREYTFASSPGEADAIAIRNDACAVSEDLEVAIDRYRQSVGR